MEERYVKNLNYLRTLKGLSQKELAEEVGVKYATISSYERGRTIPDIYIAVKIANVFGVTVEDMVTKKVVSKWE